ncbi:MAG TPA: ABC transporter substrate-binding protein [Ilumatobacter sp.]
MRRTAIAALLVCGLLVTACGDDDAESTDTAAPSSDTTADTGAPAGTADTATPGDAAACADGKTLAPGELTIATGEPAFPPYVIDDAPETGEGFEAAVAMAVAREMGFEGDAVKWIRTTFDGAIQPGPKDFDFNLQQYTITPERAEVVSFSDPYYTAAQAIFGLADAPAADAKTIADLQGLKIGVQASTTSLTYVEDVIQPTEAPLVFNDNAAAKQALDGNQIDAIVADLPTALFITAVEMEGTAVYGQIEGSGTDQFGLLLEKDNPLVECVNAALATLTDSGELEAITTEWMADYTEAPIITLT